MDIKRTLEEVARGCQWLVLWLDCDREGENIAFEVIEVCTAVNRQLTLRRARFSALIERCCTLVSFVPFLEIPNFGLPWVSFSVVFDLIFISEISMMQCRILSTQTNALRMQWMLGKSVPFITRLSLCCFGNFKVS